VLGDLVRMFGAMAAGDLTQRIAAEYQGMFGKLKDDANSMADRISVTMTEVKNAANEVAGAASEISAGTTDLSQRTEEQAASLEETSASMEEIAATVKKNAASQMTADSQKVAARGGEVVSEAVSAMAKIEDSSRRISDIIGVIDEIARQTNLLALNAAVEAARARRGRPRLCGGCVRSAEPCAALLAGRQRHQGSHHQQQFAGAGWCRPGEPGRSVAGRNHGCDQARVRDRVRNRGGEFRTGRRCRPDQRRSARWIR
jgi:prophage DNA circulation protein